MPSFGFHVWSLGNWVPGEVCLACPVAGCCEEGGEVGDLRAALGADLGGGGRGDLLELEAFRICSAVEGIIGDAWRRCADGREEGRMALSAARGSILGFNSIPVSDYRSIAVQSQSISSARGRLSATDVSRPRLPSRSSATWALATLSRGESRCRHTFPIRQRPTKRTRLLLTTPLTTSPSLYISTQHTNLEIVWNFQRSFEKQREHQNSTSWPSMQQPNVRR